MQTPITFEEFLLSIDCAEIRFEGAMKSVVREAYDYLMPFITDRDERIALFSEKLHDVNESWLNKVEQITGLEQKIKQLEERNGKLENTLALLYRQACFFSPKDIKDTIENALSILTPM